MRSCDGKPSRSDACGSTRPGIHLHRQVAMKRKREGQENEGERVQVELMQWLLQLHEVQDVSIACMVAGDSPTGAPTSQAAMACCNGCCSFRALQGVTRKPTAGVVADQCTAGLLPWRVAVSSGDCSEI
eukprot:scaffold12929_cov21-Tisochrysis_lutea.AAC.7